MSAITVMSQHLARIHPFVPASLLKAGRDEEIDEDERLPENREEASSIGPDRYISRNDIESAADKHSNDEGGGSGHEACDRFVVQDVGKEGHGAFRAVRKDTASTTSKLYATAVRVASGDKYCSVIRFFDDLPHHFPTAFTLGFRHPKRRDLTTTCL